MPGAGIWTSEAISAPKGRHLSGEAWPREHLQRVKYEQSGSGHAGVQVADDHAKQCITLFTKALSVIRNCCTILVQENSQLRAAPRDNSHTLGRSYIVRKLCVSYTWRSPLASVSRVSHSKK